MSKLHIYYRNISGVSQFYFVDVVLEIISCITILNISVMSKLFMWDIVQEIV